MIRITFVCVLFLVLSPYQIFTPTCQWNNSISVIKCVSLEIHLSISIRYVWKEEKKTAANGLLLWQLISLSVCVVFKWSSINTSKILNNNFFLAMSYWLWKYVARYLFIAEGRQRTNAVNVSVTCKAYNFIKTWEIFYYPHWTWRTSKRNLPCGIRVHIRYAPTFGCHSSSHT